MKTNREDLFKKVANTLVGYWFNFMTDELLIFSLPDILTEKGSVQVIAGGTSYLTDYCIQMHPNREISVQINKLFESFAATIKVINRDTLIFQGTENNIYIYERKPMPEFANKLISEL